MAYGVGERTFFGVGVEVSWRKQNNLDMKKVMAREQFCVAEAIVD